MAIFAFFGTKLVLSIKSERIVKEVKKIHKFLQKNIDNNLKSNEISYLAFDMP